MSLSALEEAVEDHQEEDGEDHQAVRVDTEAAIIAARGLSEL